MTPATSDPYYHIVSLDGGGIRGVLTAALLERLEAECPGFIAQVDLFAGTSTGGILALGLAAGLSPATIRRLYEDCGPKIFAHSFPHEVQRLDQLIEAEYSNGPLEQALWDLMGDATLGELPHRVLVSSFDLDNAPPQPGKPRMWKAKFFHNFPGEGSDADQKVVDVALRTSAAPTYFPIHQGYVDGGVVANNPSLCALAQALHPGTDQQQVNQLTLLSLSTGLVPRFLPQQDDRWGLVQWAPHLVDVMMDGSVGLADYQCRQILGDRYWRIDPVLPSPIGLEQVEAIPVLEAVAANEPLEAAIAWIKRNY